MKELRDRRRKELTAETPFQAKYHTEAEEILSLYVKVTKEFLSEFSQEKKKMFLDQIIKVYSQDDDKVYMIELMNVAKIKSKKKWEEAKVTSEFLDIKVDLMLLLRKERFLLERLALRMRA